MSRSDSKSHIRIGVIGKGASRWIQIFGYSIQPSELIKVFIVFIIVPHI